MTTTNKTAVQIFSDPGSDVRVKLQGARTRWPEQLPSVDDGYTTLSS
jgi:hypothetical protein